MEKRYRKGEIRLVKPEQKYLDEIIDNLREEDRREAWNAWRLSPTEVIEMSAKSAGEAWVILHNEKTVGIFGVSPKSFLTDTGIIWFLGTTEIEKIWLTFGKETSAIVQRFLKKYQRLENWAAFENKKTLRWLKRNGFQIEAPKPYGVYDEKFCYFWQTRGK